MPPVTAVTACWLLALALLLPGCGDGEGAAADRRRHLLAGATMGTTFAVTVVATGAFDVSELERAVLDRLETIDRQMSTYRPDSELVQFNRARSTDPRPMSRETVGLVADAAAVSRATSGAFDVTVGPLVDLWGFGPGGEVPAPPSAAAVAAARVRVGYALLEADPLASTLRKRHPALAVDLSAIAKGYAVDAVATLLGARGFEDHLVEIGGELRAAGVAEDGSAWRVAIERPVPGASVVQRIVRLRDVALATSGDYRNFYELDGRRVAHTIDPRTGRPVTHRLRSVSVLAERCAVADARATALEVLGPDDGRTVALAEEWAALLVVEDESGALHEWSTPAFDAHVQ